MSDEKKTTETTVVEERVEWLTKENIKKILLIALAIILMLVFFQKIGVVFVYLKKFWDINVDAYNPDKYPNPMEAEIEREAQEYSAQQAEIEYAFKEAAGYTYFGVEDWEPEWDYYCADREKQIIRIAHELADKHENLPTLGSKSWVSLVYPFYKEYELNSDERCLFTQEYYTQHFFRYGYV